MKSKNFSYTLHKLRLSLRGRCPECEQGQMFQSYFALRETCPYCDVRFSRNAGDAIGGVYINVAIAELTALIGFSLVNSFTSLPIIHQLLIWIPYLIIFTIVFYPYARGLWIGVTYLIGGIYADPDYHKEYIAPYHRPDKLLSMDYADEPTDD
jgi:uncharacterized protein (DUF983 family)